MTADDIVYFEFPDKCETEIDCGSLLSQAAGELESSILKKRIILNLENVFISDGLITALQDIHRKYHEKITSTSVFGVGKGLRKLIIISLGYPISIAKNREEAFEGLYTEMEELT